MNGIPRTDRTAMNKTAKIYVAGQGPKVDLEKLIPKTFGEWRQKLAVSVQVVGPQRSVMIDNIYNQTLSRTYASEQG